jgi:DNA-binding transcriptional LysR family regulator
MMNLSDVLVFLEIAQSGSFTGAAKSLRIPKSSAARQIARLEDDLGYRLLRRTTRTVALTEEGRSFLPHARRLYHDSVEAQLAVGANAPELHGEISIASPNLFARAFVAPFLAEFRRAHPAVTFGVRATPERIDVGSDADRVDIAIRLRTEAIATVGIRKIGQLDFCLAAAPDYLASRSPIVDPAALADESFVELGPAHKDHRLELSRGSERHSFRYVPSVQIDDPESVRTVVAAGGGIAALPLFVVADDFRRGTLVRILEEWKPAPVPVSVLYRTDVSPPMRVRAYIDFLHATFQRENERLTRGL